MERTTMRSLTAMVIFFLACTPIRPQSQETGTPKVPGRSLAGFTEAAQNTDSQDTLQPDQNPLTGAQQFTLGSPEMRHTYWVPGFQFENLAQSSPQGSPQTGWQSTSFILGNLSLFTQSRHSESDVNYSGGGSVTDAAGVQNSSYQQLELSQKFTVGRWRLTLLDNFIYLPQSSFGFGGGVGTLATPGVGGALGASFPGLQPNYMPDQSVFTNAGSRYTNAAVTQLEYSVTPRASLTAIASYGVLRFDQAGTIESNDTIFSLGYNYRLTAVDTLGVLYRFSAFRYLGNPQALDDHSANLAYGRKVTGRSAIQLFAGPEVTTYRIPVGTQTDNVSVSAGASLTYAFRRANLTLSYSRGLSPGGGLQLGASRDLIQGQLSDHLTRLWQARVGFGYARNAAVAGQILTASSHNLNSVYCSAGLDRSLGRSASFSLTYAFDYQNVNQASCNAGNCGPNYVVHQVWVGFRWRTSPIVMR